MILNATATWLNKVITSGGSVIMIDSTAEVPGAVVVETEGLADALVAAVAPDLGISPPAPGIGFMHRHCQDIDVYFVANTGPTTRRFRIAARTSAGSYEQWDAMSGRVLGAGVTTEGIELTLRPYEATVVVLTEPDVEWPLAGGVRQ